MVENRGLGSAETSEAPKDAVHTGPRLVSALENRRSLRWSGSAQADLCMAKPVVAVLDVWVLRAHDRGRGKARLTNEPSRLRRSGDHPAVRDDPIPQAGTPSTDPRPPNAGRSTPLENPNRTRGPSAIPAPQVGRAGIEEHGLVGDVIEPGLLGHPTGPDAALGPLKVEAVGALVITTCQPASASGWNFRMKYSGS